MRRYVVEFIGTFFLILTIFMLVLGGNDETVILAPIGIGAMLIGVIYAGGHISKAHYNPAVTLACFLSGTFPKNRVMGYIIAQLLAALLAPIVARLMLEKIVLTEPEALVTIPSLIAEFLGTFALIFVILNVAIAKGTEGNNFYGMAIGLTVIGGIYTFGDISGAAFNPAVALSICLNGLKFISDIWIYLVANILGAVVATYTFLFVTGKE